MKMLANKSQDKALFDLKLAWEISFLKRLSRSRRIIKMVKLRDLINRFRKQINLVKPKLELFQLPSCSSLSSTIAYWIILSLSSPTILWRNLEWAKLPKHLNQLCKTCCSNNWKGWVISFRLRNLRIATQCMKTDKIQLTLIKITATSGTRLNLWLKSKSKRVRKVINLIFQEFLAERESSTLITRHAGYARNASIVLW